MSFKLSISNINSHSILSKIQVKEKVHTYNCFSEKGEDCLPTNEMIDEYIQLGIEPIIFLDSCVCLHIIKVVDYGKAATNIDINRIINLKAYLNKHPNVRISPLFAILELCTRDGKLDENKLKDFKYRIDFFEQIPFKILRKFEYNFSRDYLIVRELPTIISNPFSAIEPIINKIYCALLKIRSLALMSLSKESCEKNIITFFDWMVNDLDSVRGIEYKLAMNIFGGNTEFRKMIGLDSKPSDVRRKLMGTCWDIFHAKNTSNSFQLFQMLQRNIQPYFLTSDTNLFKIFKNLSLTIIKDGGENFISSFILNSDFSCPHLGNEFIDSHNRKIMSVFIERRNRVHCFNEKKVEVLIRDLELENNLTSINSKP